MPVTKLLLDYNFRVLFILLVISESDLNGTIDARVACRATERGGQGGTMTAGPMDFRKAVGFSGPIEMTLRNQHVRPEDLFFFGGDHLISSGKTKNR